jgi:cupin 2 domain-containing protein
MTTRNLFADLPEFAPEELFEVLAEGRDVTVERIVSTGQATPPDEWLCQERHEWVILLRGRAALRFAEEGSPRDLAPGDHLLIRGGTRHRVDWTSQDEPTVWLAVHFA